MGSLRGGYYYCHHFSFQSGVPARSAPAAPFLQSQSSSLQVKDGLNGMHLPGPNFPAGFQVPLSAPQGSCHAPAPLSGGYLAACCAHSFPFQFRPRGLICSADPGIGVPVHSLPTWPCWSTSAFQIQGSFLGSFQVCPHFQLPCLGRDHRRACGAGHVTVL